MEEENYENAVTALLSPVHQSTTPSAIRAAAARRTNTLKDMNEYLCRLGLNVNSVVDADCDESSSPHYLPPIIIHVTGTKGKGSTLSFCESLLRNVYKLNTGLFTSPHLVSIRERIRINGVPISKKVFGDVYWRIRRKLELFEGVTQDDDSDHIGVVGELPPLPTLPGYFRMLTLMALYTFTHHQQPKVDAILLEVGMGGRYDATNIFEPVLSKTTRQSTPSTSPIPSISTISSETHRILVRGITLIDYDHTRVLGSTLEQIAWEKGGIFVSNKLQNIGMDDGGYDAFLQRLKEWKCTFNTGNSILESRTNESSENCVQSSSSNYTLATFVNGNNNPQVLDILKYITNQQRADGETSGNDECIGLQIIHDSSLNSFAKVGQQGMLGLQGSHQQSNAALAVAMCRYAMSSYCKSYPHHQDHKCESDISGIDLPTMDMDNERIALALGQTFWPGRCHTVCLDRMQYNQTLSQDMSTSNKLSINLRCDGAHTPISIKACIDWFRSITEEITVTSMSPTQKAYKILIFNCSHERNPLPLLTNLYSSHLFDEAYFCRADFERPSAIPKRLEKDWLHEELELKDFTNNDPHVTTLEKIRHVLDAANCYNSEESLTEGPSWQTTLANVWKSIDGYCRHIRRGCTCKCDQSSSIPLALESVEQMKVSSDLTVKEALVKIQQNATSLLSAENGRTQARDSTSAPESSQMLVEVCITGSLYIVGSALEAAGWEEGESSGHV